MRNLVVDFRYPEETFAGCDESEMASIAAATADISVAVDDDGIVRDVAFSAAIDDDARKLGRRWVGKSWIDTLTKDSAEKARYLLDEAPDEGASAPRQVNHLLKTGRTPRTLPVSYTSLRLPKTGRILMVGRSLAALSTLQARLVEAQQAMERDYDRIRRAEARYRLMFQDSSDAKLIADATTRRVQEVNAAAEKLFGVDAKRLVGRPFLDRFHKASEELLLEALDAVRSRGRRVVVDAHLHGSAENGPAHQVALSVFREGGGLHVLIHVLPMAEPHHSIDYLNGFRTPLVDLVSAAPDAVVLLDVEGQVQWCNDAFLDFTEVAASHRCEGEPVERYLGRSSVEVSLLLETLRDEGQVRRFRTVLRGERGAVEEVEVSGIVQQGEGEPMVGLFMRRADQSATVANIGETPGDAFALSRTPSELRELVGRIPLKDLVRETTDVIERMSIEAALELTGNNRASAAEMLGLSRQSLYVKLRRFGIIESDGDDAVAISTQPEAHVGSGDGEAEAR
ncbi:MAG: transcriptional regulator PpsR [Pseudomonadota bacterium]